MGEIKRNRQIVLTLMKMEGILDHLIMMTMMAIVMVMGTAIGDLMARVLILMVLLLLEDTELLEMEGMVMDMSQLHLLQG